jgi:uroporphyrinogen decarboxylase
MLPRERTLTAIARKATDRTPCDFWAEDCTWNRLLASLGHNNREKALLDLEIDMRHLDLPAPPEKEIGNGVVQNFWGERYIFRETPWGKMREDVRGALADASRFSDLQDFDWPVPGCFDYPSLARQCRSWEQYALVYGFADVWQRPGLVRGWEGMFVDMAERPEWVHFLCRRFTDFYLEDYGRAFEATNGRIDLFLLISDLGSQTGPLISLSMFRRFVAPYLQEMTDLIHNFGARVLYHSCGCIRRFIPDLIEIGIDVLDPVQPVSLEMSPESLKREFGAGISFHGGIDMQRLLPSGTPGEVRAQARRYCRTLGAGGGYILGPAHLFQPDVPPENILAVYEAGVRS